MSFKNQEDCHRFMKKKGIPIPTKEEADFIMRSYPHNYKKSICPICKEEIYQYIGGKKMKPKTARRILNRILNLLN